MNFELDHPEGETSAVSGGLSAWAKKLPSDLPLELQKLLSDDPDSPFFGGVGGGVGASDAGTDLDFSGLDAGDGSSRLEDLRLLLQLANSTHNLNNLNVGPLEMSDDEQLFLNILYGAAIFMAVAGNLAVILVFLFGRRWNSDLSIFLVNLAFSDIVLAVFCMPFTMSQVVKHHWQFSEVLCPIVLFLQLSSVIASVYTLVAIGVDRYLFVTRPLKARLTKRKGKLVIGSIWLFALALSSVQLAVVNCVVFDHGGKKYKDCQETWPSDNYRTTYTVIVAFLTYIIPLSVLMFVYIRVGKILWQRTPPGETVHLAFPSAITGLNSAGRAEERRVKSKQRVVKMLVVIVLVFAICWFPLHLFFLVIDFFPDVIRLWRENLHELAFTYTFLAIHFLAMSSSYVNPLIYSFMNQNFRSDVRQLWHRASSAVKHCFRRWGNHEGYDSEDDESIQPFRRSPNSGLKRSSSTPPMAPEYLQRMAAPYPLIEQLSGRTGSDCSRSECQACASNQSGRSKSRERSSGPGRLRKEDTYG